MPMITDIEDYFEKGCGRCDRFATDSCSVRIWNDGVRALRAICLQAGLKETVKWGHPCYMHAGRNIAIIGALRGEFRLSFFNVALMTDPEGVLRKQGPNTQHRDMIRFERAGDVIRLEPTILAYLAEAMDYAERGIRPRKEPSAMELPDELVEALDADPELAEAFHRLTPGRQKSYVIHLNQARKSETRVARIGKARPKIIAGKGAMER